MNHNHSYLTFGLEKELFALPVERIQKILEIQPITEVPKSPPYMTGIINLKGKIVPVIDLRKKLGLGPGEITKSTCLLVSEVRIGQDPTLVCLLVDIVQAVLKIGTENRIPPPSLGDQFQSHFIVGMAKINDELAMILEPDVLFASDEPIDIKTLKNENLQQPRITQ